MTGPFCLTTRRTIGNVMTEADARTPDEIRADVAAFNRFYWLLSTIGRTIGAPVREWR